MPRHPPGNTERQLPSHPLLPVQWIAGVEHQPALRLPAYDPDTNRIEWFWRISRRIVTHNHHRRDFEALLTDARTHFESLTRIPDDLLRHIGSLYASDKKSIRSQADAA